MSDKQVNSGTDYVSAIASVGSQHMHENKGVALPTAMLSIKHGSRITKFRALFDQGSQRTFILQTVASKLRLKIIKRITLTIDSFSAEGKSSEYAVVQFLVETNRGLKQMEAIVVDSLPARINMPGIFVAAEKLKKLGIPLADSFMHGSCVDNVSILVGSEQY